MYLKNKVISLKYSTRIKENKKNSRNTRTRVGQVISKYKLQVLNELVVGIVMVMSGFTTRSVN